MGALYIRGWLWDTVHKEVVMGALYIRGGYGSTAHKGGGYRDTVHKGGGYRGRRGQLSSHGHLLHSSLVLCQLLAQERLPEWGTWAKLEETWAQLDLEKLFLVDLKLQLLWWWWWWWCVCVCHL